MKLLIAPHLNNMNLKLMGLRFSLPFLFFVLVLLKDSKALVSKEKEVKKIEKELNALQEASEKDADALAVAQQHFNAVSAGLSSNDDGEEATLAGQMMTCKNEISKAVTEAKQVRIKALPVSDQPSCFFSKLSENQMTDS